VTVKKQATSKTEENEHDEGIEEHAATKKSRYITRTEMAEDHAR
jgi:hypothetical protein